MVDGVHESTAAGAIPGVFVPARLVCIKASRRKICSSDSSLTPSDVSLKFLGAPPKNVSTVPADSTPLIDVPTVAQRMVSDWAFKSVRLTFKAPRDDCFGKVLEFLHDASSEC